MVNYRRNKTNNPDDIFFLTIVTHNRDPWIARLTAYGLIRTRLSSIRLGYGIKIQAWVILPDHLHLLIRPCKADYSGVVRSFKRGIGAELKSLGIITDGIKLWQDRFWESTVKNKSHYEMCLDYIHFNPVKHNLVSNPSEWRESSFIPYVNRGIYPLDWCNIGKEEILGAEFD